MDKTFTNNVQNAQMEIANRLRDYYGARDYISFMAITYLLYKASCSIRPHISYNELIESLGAEEGMLIRDCLRLQKDEEEIVWSQVSDLAINYAPAVFVNILMQPVPGTLRERRLERPGSVNMLLDRFLNLHDGEKVLEISSGLGDTLIALSGKHNCDFNGVELISAEKGISELRTALLNKNINIKLGNFIEQAYAEAQPVYDKVYSYPHPGVRLVNDATVDKLNAEFKGSPFRRSSALDWAMALAAVKSLKNDGVAIMLVADGCLFMHTDEAIRRFFIEKGLLKAVISLPKKLFTTANVNISMLILSKGNELARLVNARDICQEGRRQNTLSDEDIDKIVDLYQNGGKHTVDVGPGHIQPNRYSLSPEAYMTLDNIDLKHPVEFGSIIEEIGRSMPLSAHQLDELVSEEPTDIRYIRGTDIQDGIINSELPYLKSIESRYERYLLKDGDLLLSKINAPFKAAIVKLEKGEKVLPIGNMYVIRVDKSKIDVHYLKAFLESSKGLALLNSATSGTTLPVINVDSLQRMPIECPDFAKQEKIATKYQAISDEIALLKAKLTNATERLGNVVDEEEDE
ncbi:N-6 DNA methylase [Phascolarctobacterium succinatutens]|uniref:N-6 DNA methylase n=1 Tax=Phascolarctobacterium succinatutens TaxID=626940 RepID=UPI0026ED6A70|nr:N-6 DNA methylase [Phascolarctobacterium succinatutens]